MPKDPRVSVGVCTILYRFDYYAAQYEVLLGLRASTLEPGYWSFPGGWLDWGEQPIDAAVRELREEIGLEIGVRQLSFLGVRASELPSIETWCTTLYYVRHMPDSVLTSVDVRLMEPDKCKGWRWFPVTAIPQNFMGSDSIMSDLFKDFKVLDAPVYEV